MGVDVIENGYHFGMLMRRRSQIRPVVGVLVAALAVAAAATALAACGSTAGSSGSSGTRLAVVAGENFWGDIAAQVGGARVRVTSLISDPSADPHLYQSNAADAAAVARARVVIVNGAGYDDFMGRLLSASGGHPTVVTAQDVLGEHGASVNPHFWYDVARVPLVAQAIERALAAADPAGATAYQAGLRRFDASLAPVLAVVAKIKSAYAGQPVGYTERVPGYLLADAGLTVVTPPGFATAIENGNDPSAADTQAMQALIAGHKMRLLLYNAQTTSAVTQHVRALAQQAGIAVVGVTETQPASDPSYQAWQLRQATAILRALGG
jgi:zinc/manganese transport system substrate-binding protein